jgi:hypothetical protein
VTYVQLGSENTQGLESVKMWVVEEGDCVLTGEWSAKTDIIGQTSNIGTPERR